MLEQVNEHYSMDLKWDLDHILSTEELAGLNVWLGNLTSWIGFNQKLTQMRIWVQVVYLGDGTRRTQ